MYRIALIANGEERRELLSRAVDLAGGKAALGRKLGYLDGAFIGQMLNGKRAITEKTLRELANVRELKPLFESRQSDSASPADAAPPEPDLRTALRVLRNQLAQGQGDALAKAAEALHLLAKVPDSERAFDAALQNLEALAVATVLRQTERPLGAPIAHEHDERLRQMAEQAEELHAQRTEAGGGHQRRRTPG